MTINHRNLEFGLDTFGDLAFDDTTKERISYSESLRNIGKNIRSQVLIRY